MKIVVNHKKDLLDCLQQVNSVVEKRNTLPILSNILLSAQKEELTIKATDLEVSTEISLPVTVLQPGKATISAKSFLEIVRELPEKEIQINSKENNWVGISCGSSHFNLMGLSPEDFPALPTYGSRNPTRAISEVLRRMIDHTSYAISQDETRYQMNGIFFESPAQGQYAMVATNGALMAYFHDQPFEGPGLNLPKGVIIPRKGVGEIRRLLDGAPPTVELNLEGNHLLFRTNRSFLSVRLIEGQFPDYKQPIPKTVSRVVELDRQALFSSLTRVSLMANEKSRGVKLSLSKGKLEISSSNPELGEATETLETPFSGDSLEIAFNAKFLQDALSVIQSPSVLLHLNDRMSPGVVRIPGSDQYLSVLMPMRL
jgi:DNA polymerase III subunit beta